MDVTPSRKMFDAMALLVESTCGPEPHPKIKGVVVDAIRARRRAMFDTLHHLVAISMREGVHRFIREAEAKMRGPEDAQDRNAMAKAKDDAQADAGQVKSLDGKDDTRSIH